MNKTEFVCRECGEKQRIAVLKTRHGLKGTASMIERNAECCDNPSYTHKDKSARAIRA